MEATRRAVYTEPSIRRHAFGIAVATREHRDNEAEARNWWRQARARHEGREGQIIAGNRHA